MSFTKLFENVYRFDDYTNVYVIKNGNNGILIDFASGNVLNHLSKIGVETIEYIKHATTVVPSKDELFISFGEKNTTYGKNRLFIPLPKNADFGAMMAIGYYIVGKIQKSHPPYFKKNIQNYTKQASKIFKHTIKPIVE